jgi:transaldolase
MVGRLDDWLKNAAEQADISIDPAAFLYAGIACVKKAYRIYKEKAYRTRLLSAAYRHHLHWSEFIGGEMTMTIPHSFQLRFNRSDIEMKARINDEVNPFYISELRKVPDFVKAYDEMDTEEFNDYGAVNVTLEQFLNGYDDLVKIVRKFFIRY